MKAKKQQLRVKLKNVPRNTSLVPCSTSPGLNREETLSDQSIVLTCNNSEENRSRHRGSSDLRVQNIVYALNMRGMPLMPTTQQKANKLLRERKAKVIGISPFTIQMLVATGETEQPVKLGIDTGYSKIGFSAVASKKELISGEVKLRTDVRAKLTEKRMYRRGRRNKLWYRKPRFDNRVSTKKKGWLAPSIQHKLDSHVRLVNKIKKLLPVSNTIIEVASFDTQRMQNPEVSGIEYQQGELQGYEVREYLLEKWKRTCVYCGEKDVPLEVEHIIPRSRGGTDRVSNLTIACHKCNQKKGKMTAEEFGYPDVQKEAKETLKGASFMNIVRQRLVNIMGCSWTYGYIIKHNRVKLGLEKSHSNDAFVIAGGNGQMRTVQYNINQYRRNNRCLQLNRKGFKPSIRRQRYSLQPHDLVKFDGKILEVKGCHCLGKRVMLENKKSVDINKVEFYKYGGGWQFLPRINPWVSLPNCS